MDPTKIARPLSLDMKGEQVRLLHAVLIETGFSVSVDETQEQRFGLETCKAVIALQELLGLRATGSVDQHTAHGLEKLLERHHRRSHPFIVRGRVRDRDGSPLAGLKVRAFDKDMRHEQPLGDAVTDRHGSYEVMYRASSFRRAEKSAADIIVRAYDADGKVKVESATSFNAPRILVVDLLVGGGVYRGPSEYERLTTALRPLLEGVAPASLTVDDVSFLSAESGFASEWIGFFALSDAIAAQTELAGEAFYGLMRQHLPASLSGLLAQSPRVIERGLRGAIAQNVISQAMASQIPGLLARLRELNGKLPLQAPAKGAPPTLGSLLATGISDAALQQEFANRYLAHQGEPEQFWDSLRADRQFGEQTVSALQFTLQVSALADSHLPLVEELQRQRAAGQLSSVQDLARLDEDDWFQLLDKPSTGGGPIGAPAGTPGTTPVERMANYASTLNRIVEDNFPTAVFADRLARNQTPNSASVVAFLRQNPDFDLARGDIPAYLSQKGIPLSAADQAQLAGAQRVFKLVPQVSAALPLLAAGIDSAAKVVQIPRHHFIQLYSKQMGGDDLAGTVFNNASQAAATALAVYANHGAAFHLHLDAMNDPAAYKKAVPNYEQLFGSLSQCDCEDCQSITSPSAYLIDLLVFLDRHKPSPQALAANPSLLNGRDVLLGNGTAPGRRPDLKALELTCDNTLLALPYIDLVNEILEEAVSPTGTVVPETVGTQEELRVNPQKINTTAYDTLRATASSLSLPFDLWAETARVYLDHLGVPRARLMETFRNEAETTPAPEVIAGEYLQLSKLDREVITGLATPPKGGTWGFWGLDQQNQIVEPPDGTAPVARAWNDLLREVYWFLHQSGLTYQQLLDLLACDFVQKSGAITITPPEECDIYQLRLTGMGEPALDRIHRFIRLWRKLGWTMAELDRAIHTFAATDLTPALLVQLGLVARLSRELALPVLRVLAWFGPFDPTLYVELFQNPSVIQPLDPAFTLDASGSPANAGDALLGHAATIQAALNLSADDLTLLTDATRATARLNVPPALNAPNLTIDALLTCYRIATLSQALDLSVEEFLAMKALTQRNLFDATGAEDTRRFIDDVRLVQASPFSVEDLSYLLRHVPALPPELDQVQPVIDLFRVQLVAGLQKIAADNLLVPDPTGAVTRRKLAVLLPQADADAAMALILGAWSKTDAERKSFITDTLGFVPNGITVLTAPATLTDDQKAQRIALVLAPLLQVLQQVLSESLVKKTVAETFALDQVTAERVVTQLVHAPSNASLGCIVDLLEVAVVDNTTTEQHFNQAALRIYKLASIVGKLRLTSDWLWAFDKTSARLILDPDTLPVAPSGPAQAAFRAWTALDELVGLRATFPEGESALLECVNQATKVSTVALLVPQIAKLTNWSSTDLANLLVSPGLGLAFPADYISGRALVRISDAFATAKRIGVAPSTLRDWTAAELTAAQAADVKKAVKAKYQSNAWLTNAQPLQNELRERQRDALVAYLVADRTRGFADADDLFGYYLIDVEMGACQLTSRIKQAISSVQLFVQRCFLNLEPMVTLDMEAANEWKWRKSYRLWEANRLVFLFPENWVLSELRYDKTAFFVDLENEIIQNEITADRVEAAYVHYLEKLESVSKLEICGLYREAPGKDDPDAQDRIHVIARSQEEPRVYWYRMWRDHNDWSAWEGIDLDIEGDHLIPIAYNRRLYLFWAVFRQKSAPGSTTASPSANPEPPFTTLEISLAWSEYRNGTWTAKKTSTDKLTSVTRNPNPPSYHFRGTTDGETLTVEMIVRDFFPAAPAQPQGQPQAPSQRDVGDGISVATFDNSQTIQGPALYESGRTTFRLDSCHGRLQLVSSVLDPNFWLLSPDDTVLDGQGFLEASQDQRGHVNDTPLDAQADEIPGSPIQQFDPPNPNDPNVDNQLYLVTGPNGLATDQASLAANVTRVPTLKRTPGRFRLVPPHQDEEFLSKKEFFFEDPQRVFLVRYEAERVRIDRANRIGPEVIDRIHEAYYPTAPVEAMLSIRRESGSTLVVDRQLSLTGALKWPQSFPKRGYRFYTFYHPYVCDFIKQVNRWGVDGLLHPADDTSPLNYQALNDDYFESVYEPEDAVYPVYPIDDIDFQPGGAYSQYNWELFFHAPLLIATRLSSNQRFEEAQQWYHYIFDPTTGSSDPVPQRFWRIRPFHEDEAGKPIQELLKLLDTDPTTPEAVSLALQVQRWIERPFDPHVIARLRWTAYQKTVFMNYIDNLIAWGDQLFRQDTIESINEATQLYVLAGKILGGKPQRIPARTSATADTVGQLLASPLDDFSNVIENKIPPASGATGQPLVGTGLGNFLHFCIPKNDKLLGYWDLVADRLFKIRHCMNIEGVVRQLPLFEPPLDVGMLVAAAAAGVDLNSVLQDTEAAVPNYRFNVMMQKALDLCNEVRSLGAALLSALEKRDAEELAQIRSRQEVQLLKLVRDVKSKQVDEATRQGEQLDKYRELVTLRHEYYRDIEFMNDSEKAHLGLAAIAAIVQAVSQSIEAAGGIAHLVPDFTLGVSGIASPVVTVTFGGGSNVGPALAGFGRALGVVGALAREGGAIAQTVGGYQRRADDWALQRDLASKELEQIDKQAMAAAIRLDIANTELTNHDQQIDNATQVDRFMHDKFSNRDLYDWMSTQIATIYFQAYTLAYDAGKRAERAFRHEIGDPQATFVDFGYWDSLKKGLLAGERLNYDLQRMQLAFVERNEREYEITKHISLALLDATKLVQLRESGECLVQLHEEVFDADYPGHYLRRLKSVAVSIPCVTGPFTGVNATISLTWSGYRKNSDYGTTYPRATNPDGSYRADPKFVDQVGTVQSIVTSTAQSDGGLFETRLDDPRYLPFEGRGAISEWRIQLPLATNRIARETISDVVFHLRYTAREGGKSMADAAQKAEQAAMAKNGVLLFSAKHDFPMGWQRFLHPADDEAGQTLELDLGADRFPRELPGEKNKLTGMVALLKFNGDKASDVAKDFALSLVPPALPAPSPAPLPIASNGTVPPDLVGLGLVLNPFAGIPSRMGTWSLVANETAIAKLEASALKLAQNQTINGKTHDRLTAAGIDDIWVVCYYDRS